MRSINTRSIRFRLTASYAAILALTFACAAVLVWLTLGHSIKATIDRELRAELATVRSYVEQEAGGTGARHLSEELNEDAVANAGSAYLRIADHSGALIYASPNVAAWPRNIRGLESPLRSDNFATIFVDGKPFRVLTAPVSIGTVQIGLPLEEFHELRRDFVWTIALGGPLFFLVAMIAGYWMSGRALRPVDRIATAAQRITSANLSERLPYTGARDELDRLSQVLNEMLGRLECSFRRVTQFTADASHELRTPLAIIRTTAELMSSRQRTPEEHERAWASILTQTDRTTALVKDLLTLARGDDGVEVLKVQPTDLAAITSAAVSEMQVLASSKGVHLRFSASAHPVLLADQQGLIQVLAILLDNAVKASDPDGCVEVSVDAWSGGAEGDTAITVKDTGIGIAAKHLPYIFDRFYRVSEDRSRETGGAGLGLAIAERIVNQHGGRINVDSEVGKGATFRVILPSWSKSNLSSTAAPAPVSRLIDDSQHPRRAAGASPSY